MSFDSSDDDRLWAAAKQDFLADARDAAANLRQAAADARDALADTRDAELDLREQRLNECASDLGITTQSTDRAVAHAARLHAVQERANLTLVRQAEDTRRQHMSERRLAENQPTLLAMAFAGIDENLYQAASYDEVLARIADAAVTTISGSDAASVTLPVGKGYRSVGATGPAATKVDQAQYDAGEGPCLDAVGDSAVVSAPAFPDERWPQLGATPRQHGVESSLAYQLAGIRPGTQNGSLNIYAGTPDAFDSDAMQIGTILAVHASLAARAVGERASHERLGRGFQEALLNRDMIGQAKGILMERFKTTPENAFDILRSASQRLNLKLRELARGITETGELPSSKSSPNYTAAHDAISGDLPRRSESTGKGTTLRGPAG